MFSVLNSHDHTLDSKREDDTSVLEDSRTGTWFYNHLSQEYHIKVGTSEPLDIGVK